MAKTNKVARHCKLIEIAAILQEMGTQYAEQFLPGRGRARWQQLSPRAGLYTPPHMFTSTKRETSFSGRANQLSGILTTSGVQFHGAYRNRIKKPSHGVERAHKNITFAIN
jgi:hypothetical protein